MASDPFSLLSLFCCITAIGIWMETRARVAQFGVIFVIFGPTLLAAVGLIPRESELFAMISGYVLPLSIPLLLFGANLRRVVAESGKLLVAFTMAASFVLIAAIVGLFALGLSPKAQEWAAIATAGFIGGSANIAAVADSFGRASTPEMAVLVASVYVVVLPFMALLFSMPSITPVWRLIGGEEVDRQAAAADIPTEETSTAVTAWSLSLSFAASAVIVVISNMVVGATGISALRYVVITVLSLLVSTFLPHSERQLAGHFYLGQILIYLFLGTIGAQINFALVVGFGLEVVGFAVFVITLQLIALLTIGRLFKFDAPTLLVASNACVLGAATAGAMASARGWQHLVAPGILCGVLGYAVANFIGIALTAWVLGL